MSSKTILVTTNNLLADGDEGTIFNLFNQYGQIRKVSFCLTFGENSERRELQTLITYFSLDSAIRAVTTKNPEILKKKLKPRFYVKDSVSLSVASMLSGSVAFDEEEESSFELSEDDLSEEDLQEEILRKHQEENSSLRLAPLSDRREASVSNSFLEMIANLDKNIPNHIASNIHLSRIFFR